MSDNKFTRGSEWRKWDLHLHSLHTTINNNFKNDKDAYIQKLKEADISVVWLTNYFNFSEDDFLLRDELSQKGIYVLLNLELRLTYTNKQDDCLDLHIIFSDKVERSTIDVFLTKLNARIWSHTKILKDIITTEDKNTAVIEFNEIKKLINHDESLKSLKNNILIGFLSRGKGNSRSSIMYESLALECDFLIHSTDRVSNISEDTEYWLSKNKPLLNSSDAHETDKIGSKFTWIKADPTFEWLKQIIYEPEERVKVQKHKPTDNLNKISEIELKFKEDIKIQTNWSTSSYSFCFSGVNEKLYLSDYFNCFIWWRWSWKSSLLNLIYWKVSGDKDTHFLENNTFVNLDIENDLEINYNWGLEFLGQNQIEEFAIDESKFSNAIYKRLHNQKELEESKQSLMDYIRSLEEFILNVFEIERIKKDLSELDKRLKNYQSIIDVVKWEEYNNLKTKLGELSKKYYEIEKSKEKYNNLKNEYSNFLKLLSRNDTENNEYDKNYNEVFSKLEIIKTDIDNQDFSEIIKLQTKILEDGKIQKDNLNTYLKAKWLSEEKLKHLEEAQDWLYKCLLEQENIQLELKRLDELQVSIQPIEWWLSFKTYKYLIEDGLKSAQEKLDQEQNDDIKQLTFNVDIDLDNVKRDLLSDFIDNTFKSYKKTWLRSDIIEHSLFSDKCFFDGILDWTVNYLKFRENIQGLSGINNEYLKSIFEFECNFTIYKALIAKYRYNLGKYLKIEVLYDWRPIKNSSFGQKCTVVILIMLLFWDTPIMIDEPEAHLDSSLIANYLVKLIKNRKKERQIIFATHNANFVINWDAEQIYFLENKDNKTNFTQLTIENLEKRDKLMKLEWWEKAFELRKKKYIWNK